MSGSLEPDLREGLESDLYNGCKCRPDFVVEIRHVWAIEAVASNGQKRLLYKKNTISNHRPIISKQITKRMMAAEP